MYTILLLGAGKSSSALIEYLKQISSQNIWNVIVADASFDNAQQKTGDHPLVKPVALDINNAEARKTLIQKADVVISLLPPALHILAAHDCLALSKHLLTASYVDESMKSLQKEIEEKGLLFLCEMGLDPGIDHMSAMKLIEEIKSKNGIITSFKSHCGGLIAPESDDNPWHYKITWNPYNVVHAGKAGAIFRENNETKQLQYRELFDKNRTVNIPGEGEFCYYPNRNSLPYIDLYHLHEASTFVRTTLRHPEFCFGWKNIVDLNMTDESEVYDTSRITYAEFFTIHFQKYGFEEWLNSMLTSRLTAAKEVMEKLVELIEAEKQANSVGDTAKEELMIIDEKGELNTLSIDDVKDQAAEAVTIKIQEANLTMRQLFYLGINDKSIINKGMCTAAQILQSLLEKKLALKPNDKDWVLMMHEIEYTVGDKKYYLSSTLNVKGDDDMHTAMAKTVGLPLGIAATLLLEGKLPVSGLHIPTHKAIYEPVLEKLKDYDITFSDELRKI